MTQTKKKKREQGNNGPSVFKKAGCGNVTPTILFMFL